MTIFKKEDAKPRVLIIGSTGRIGTRLVKSLEQDGSTQVVRASRSQQQVDVWNAQGNEAVLLDLDCPDGFSAALGRVERLFLSTGYTVAMLQQSKNLIDAAAEAGVRFIVHLGIFGNGRVTYSYGAWHEMVERYIEGSGMAWTHLHPHFFMDNLLKAAPVVGGKLYWFMGDEQVGWIAPEDVSLVAAKVLSQGPQFHSGKQYWLATEMLNGMEAAEKLTEALGRPIEGIRLTPDDLIAALQSGAIKSPANEPTYGAGVLEWVKQMFEGKLNFKGATTAVHEVTGRLPQTLVAWARANREAILAAGASS